MRKPFSVEKMTYVADTGTVIYRSEMIHRRYKKNLHVFDAGTFVAALSPAIPAKGSQMCATTVGRGASLTT
jgi:hypothetical protein